MKMRVQPWSSHLHLQTPIKTYSSQFSLSHTHTHTHTHAKPFVLQTAPTSMSREMGIPMLCPSCCICSSLMPPIISCACALVVTNDTISVDHSDALSVQAASVLTHALHHFIAAFPHNLSGHHVSCLKTNRSPASPTQGWCASSLLPFASCQDSSLG